MNGLLDVAFGHPRGVLGRLGGAIMARANRQQEREAVERAALTRGEQVLVVGHGPGIGVELAAEAVSPGGHVLGVDPSDAMRAMATARCRRFNVELRAGGAEHTGCADASVDVVISVNNVMLWDRRAGFTELRRVLKPGGRLVITVHRHVLDVEPGRLREEAEQAGFSTVRVTTRERRRNGAVVELVARR